MKGKNTKYLFVFQQTSSGVLNFEFIKTQQFHTTINTQNFDSTNLNCVYKITIFLQQMHTNSF